ncbi:MAG TPA: VacJ family lipoprotein [Alphaproteobacteria bacterium]|nr:VacJ family lipoprotein [Alphaproteobacteria bacterium]
MKATAQITLVAAALLCLTACSEGPNADRAKLQRGEVDDPVETANRDIFGANQFADRNVMKPVAETYRDEVPKDVRHGIHNVLSNLNEPIVGLNDVLQGNFDRAWTAVCRFVVNTTAGALGIMDVASNWGLKHHDADFGQTFGVWGIPEGPFVELPFFGPSDLRDAVGLVIGIVANPFFIAGGGVAVTAAGYSRSATSAVDQRAEYLDTLDSIERTSVDYYASLRSLYLQRREALVDTGRFPGQASDEYIDSRLPAVDTSAAQPPTAETPATETPAAEAPAALTTTTTP